MSNNDTRPPKKPYRGRIAPTSSGWLHLGHAATFQIAWERARAAGGTLIYRTEDLDPARCKPEYAEGAIEDLRWWGLDWDEGPDCGGPFGPYTQSERVDTFRAAFEQLVKSGHVYPSPHSRKEIIKANSTTSPFNGEALFPSTFRPKVNPVNKCREAETINWRFRVPDGQPVVFKDLRCGETTCLAGRDFGDFLVWRRDGLPSYELAVVADDHAMEISEVVRGEDLLISTARQLLLYEALGWNPPEWYHCPLVTDPETGHRMSKTNHSLGLRTLRQRGMAARLSFDAYFSLEPKN